MEGDKIDHARRPYPLVFRKFEILLSPAETWAGRGKQPRWLIAQLRLGKKLDDFRSRQRLIDHGDAEISSLPRSSFFAARRW
jgi:hypothetical protein